MLTNRKKRIAALLTSATILSGMLLSAGTAVSAAEPDAQNTLANFYSVNPPGTDNEGNDVIDNTSSLSSYSIYCGDSVKVRLSSQNGEGEVSYDVFYKKASSSKWSKMAENTTAKAIKLTPSVATDYIVRVDAKDSSGHLTRRELPLKVVEPLTNTSYLSTDCISYGDSIKVFCCSKGGAGNTQYAVYYKRSSNTVWMRCSDYSTSNEVFVHPKVAAKYDIKIKAKDESGIIIEKVLELRVKPVSDLENGAELSANRITLGDEVMISNASSGGKGLVQFAAYYKYESSEVWKKISTYTDDEYFQFTPANSGKYVIRTKVKDTSGKVINKDIPLTVIGINDTQDMRMIYNIEDYVAVQREADPDYTLTAELPSRVNNAKSEYFPSIISQRVGDPLPDNTCIPCSIAYYMYTYEYNRLHGITTNEMNSFSPIFTYNLEEDETLNGTWFTDIYHNLKQVGAADRVHVPFGDEVFEENVNNHGKENMINYYRDLPLDEEVYRYAADHRIQYYYQYSDIGKSDKAITSVDDPDIMPIKAALADGHIWSTYTKYAISHTFALRANPDPDNPEINKDVVGQSCFYYFCPRANDDENNNSNEPVWHQVTVVGYDDNIWTDINGNGKIDPGEMGALKIANSWGENYKKHVEGCFWLAYDALNRISCVEPDPDVNKVGYKNPKRIEGLYHFTGIQLMPENYKSSVFMHYIANTNDRVNSYTYLTGEYNGETITECIDPYTHNIDPETQKTKDKTPVAYNLSNPNGYAHFVYDVSTMLRKLGAEDYTEVKWTVKFECQKSNAVLNVSDVYLCDEKNYRLYRTNDKFPLTISGVASRSFALSDNYTRYAKVNYRGLDNVIMCYYPQGDQNYDNIVDINMKRVSTAEGYTYTAIVELNDCDYYNVYFYNSKYSDFNGGNDYKLYPGENNFEAQ